MCSVVLCDPPISSSFLGDDDIAPAFDVFLSASREQLLFRVPRRSINKKYFDSHGGSESLRNWAESVPCAEPALACALLAGKSFDVIGGVVGQLADDANRADDGERRAQLAAEATVPTKPRLLLWVSLHFVSKSLSGNTYLLQFSSQLSKL